MRVTQRFSLGGSGRCHWFSMRPQSRRITPLIAGLLLLAPGRANAAPADKAAAPAPVEPATTAPEGAPAGEAPGLGLPDDTPDEGPKDPTAKISELGTRLDQMQALVANR